MNIKEIYTKSETQNEIKIQLHAAEFIRTLIVMYAEYSDKNDISYYYDLVKLSINYSMKKKIDILKSIGVPDNEIIAKVNQFQQSIATFKSAHKWENGSLISSQLTDLNYSKASNSSENYDSFITKFKELIVFLIDDSPSKTNAREKLVELIPTLENYKILTVNSLSTVLYPLSPKAFPLTNDHVQAGYENLKIKLDKKSTKKYLAAAETLETKILKEIEISEDEWHFGIVDRIFSKINSESEKNLKSLYTDLIGKRKNELKDDYNSIQKKYDEVDTVRTQLRINPDYQPGEEFISDLFIGADGVASKGQSQSNIPTGRFEQVIKEDAFLKLALDIIKTPNSDSYSALTGQWKKFFPSNNRQLINRAIAACTDTISVLANVSSFEKTFNWLLKEKIIPQYPKENKEDWFSKNKWLMEIIHNEFQAEIDNDETDNTWLNMFVWELNVTL